VGAGVDGVVHDLYPAHEGGHLLGSDLLLWPLLPRQEIGIAPEGEVTCRLHRMSGGSDKCPETSRWKLIIHHEKLPSFQYLSQTMFSTQVLA
jgi:hypothetical protein